MTLLYYIEQRFAFNHYAVKELPGYQQSTITLLILGHKGPSRDLRRTVLRMLC
ncbi:hypothetical protein Plhal304r1_c004g0015031 [Plasmopara halstedii]